MEIYEISAFRVIYWVSAQFLRKNGVLLDQGFILNVLSQN